jgi:hypothetical protein
MSIDPESWRVLRDALEELDTKMTPYSSGEWIENYVVPAGPWHRILGLIRGSLWPAYVDERLAKDKERHD